MLSVDGDLCAWPPPTLRPGQKEGHEFPEDDRCFEGRAEAAVMVVSHNFGKRVTELKRITREQRVDSEPEASACSVKAKTNGTDNSKIRSYYNGLTPYSQPEDWVLASPKMHATLQVLRATCRQMPKYREKD